MENTITTTAKRNTQTIIGGKIITIKKGDEFEFSNEIVLKHNGEKLGTFKKDYIEELRTELSL